MKTTLSLSVNFLFVVFWFYKVFESILFQQKCKHSSKYTTDVVHLIAWLWFHVGFIAGSLVVTNVSQVRNTEISILWLTLEQNSGLRQRKQTYFYGVLDQEIIQALCLASFSINDCHRTTYVSMFKKSWGSKMEGGTVCRLLMVKQPVLG